jgi:hypothetical protein
MSDHWLVGTSITCHHDGEEIDYTDTVVCLQIVKPYRSADGSLVFHDVLTDDGADYLYPPLFFHAKNWDAFEEPLADSPPPTVYMIESILNCSFCKSGILPGETTGIASTGDIERSMRNPEVTAPYGNGFINSDPNPTIICIACLRRTSEDEEELWNEIWHDDECRQGTEMRCWRQRCDMKNCSLKDQ